MARKFLKDFDILLDIAEGKFKNITGKSCQESISHYEFYQYMLIVASVITITFTFTKPRRNTLPDLWHGRPGLIFPMNTLTRSHRMSYACAFGAMAFLVYEIVLQQTYAINYTGDSNSLKAFIAIVSMIIYGMVFFPLFTSLAIGSVYGYTMGVLYVLVLAVIQIYRIYDCETAPMKDRMAVILRRLPSLLCLLYLVVSIPVRLVLAWRRGHYFSWRDNPLDTISPTLQDIRDSYCGHHVIKLFRKPRVKEHSETITGRIINSVLWLVHRFIYQRKRGFRYPSVMLSILFTAVLVVYELTFEVLVISVLQIDMVIGWIQDYLDDVIGPEKTPGEPEDVTDRRKFLIISMTLFRVVRVCIMIAVILAAIFALLNVLHALSSYRINLYAMYRGDYSKIPPVATYTNSDHCVGSLKYAGYQVGYIIWSYVLHGMVIFLFSLLLAVAIVLIQLGISGWFYYIIGYAWPIGITVVVMMVVQYAMATFVFLQERAHYLALDNREVYFNFTYFMFFYNIFLGVMSCLLRIFSAMLFGLAFLSRLDCSTLSRRFEYFDPGFRSYVGYMHMEAAHTHPVVIVFSRLLLQGLQERRDKGKEKTRKKNPCGTAGVCGTACISSGDKVEEVAGSKRDSTSSYGNGCSYDISDKIPSDENEYDSTMRRSSAAARLKWHLVYTLLHNPDLRVLRNGYLQMLRQARLMGLSIQASDCLAGFNYQQLQQRLADAREKHHHHTTIMDAIKKNERVTKMEDALREWVSSVKREHVWKRAKVKSGLEEGASSVKEESGKGDAQAEDVESTEMLFSLKEGSGKGDAKIEDMELTEVLSSLKERNAKEEETNVNSGGSSVLLGGPGVDSCVEIYPSPLITPLSHGQHSVDELNWKSSAVADNVLENRLRLSRDIQRRPLGQATAELGVVVSDDKYISVNL